MDEAVRKCLMKITIITDKHRLQTNNSGVVVQPEERNAEGVWYYQDTTKNFDKLPLMYKGKSHIVMFYFYLKSETFKSNKIEYLDIY